MSFISVPEICFSIKNLRNPSGTYLKTACLVPVVRNYDSILTTCLVNNMELLTVDSPEVEAAITTYTGTLYPSGWLWIAGKNGTKCSVLEKTNILLPFAVKTIDCFNLFYSFCGYTSKEKYKKI